MPTFHLQRTLGILLRLLAAASALVGSIAVLLASEEPELAMATVVVDGMMKSQSGAT